MRKISKLYDSFFDFATPESCYILGLLHAECNITNNYLSMQINAKDGKDVEPQLYSCGVWLQYHRQIKHWQPITDYRIGSRSMVKQLKNELSLHDKTNTFNTEKLLSISNIPLFIRGFVDGDGCWYYNEKQYLRQFSIAASITFNWESLLPLLPELDYQYKTAVSKKGHKSSHLRITNKFGVKTVFEYIYNGFDHIGIKRKRQAALDCYRYCCI